MPDPSSIGATDWTFGAVLVVVLVAAIWIIRDYLKGQGEQRREDAEWQRQLISELRAERTADTNAYKALVDQMRETQRSDTATYIDLTSRMIQAQQMTVTALDGVCVGQEKMDAKQDRYHSEVLQTVRAGQ